MSMGESTQTVRGFSLLEAMITIAILTVVSALATPQLLPEVKKAQLDGSAEAVAAFVHGARTDAISMGRCVRVRIESAQPPKLVAEVLNTFDCDGATAFLPTETQTPLNAPKIDAAAPLWIHVRELILPSPALKLDFAPAPFDSDGTRVAAGSTGSTQELRWRPTGRIYSRDTALFNDDAALKLSHTTLANDDPASFKIIVVEAQGLMCTLPRGVIPIGGIDPNDLECP